MIGLHRLGPERCHLIIGHQLVDGNLDLAWDIGCAIDKCLKSRPLAPKPSRSVFALVPGHKMAFEFNGAELWLHNHEGTAPTHWYTTCVPEEIEQWVAYYHFLVGLDTWDKETIPIAKAHIVPMKWASLIQRSGPYLPNWKLLRHLGYAPIGSPVPDPPYEAIRQRCDVRGLRMKRLHSAI